MIDERLLFLGVIWTREASRHGILALGKAARLVCWTLGLEDHRRIERLALRAEEGCKTARVALKEEQRVASR
jgi:hypothetical protein